MSISKVLKLGAALCATALILPSVAGAQSPADFYKGKNVTVLVGSGVGGGYDTYTRALVRHWAKHIPGKPNLIVQNMPGAGGIKMMNHLASKAKQDGSVFASAFAANIIEPTVDGARAKKVTKYDSHKMRWIGNISPQYNACLVMNRSPVKSIDDAMKKEVIMSATGANSSSAVMANVYNMLIGTKFKVVTGYSTSGTTLAMQRGEADGTCLSYATMAAREPALIEKKMVRWLIVLNTESVPVLPGVPPVSQFVKTEEERQILDLLIARNLMGRPFVAPPGIPADRLEALRTSFMVTMKDPAYLADAKKLRMIVDPADHVAIEKMVERIDKIPSEYVKKAVSLMSGARAMAKKAKSVKKKKKK